MSLARRIRHHRSTVLFTVLVTFSLVALASGVRATFLGTGLRTAVYVGVYPFRKAYDVARAAADYWGGLVLSYTAARTEADTLRARYAQLAVDAAQKADLLEENERLRRMIDFVRNEPRLTLEPVEVIQSSKGKLTIDRGAIHDVHEFMCVMTDRGIVGYVTQVQPFDALVFTLHNTGCNVAAMIQRNRVRGVVQGSGSDDRICVMQYIDAKDDVREGDFVVTSPESLFPSGYPIGVIAAPPSTGSLFKTAYIEPAVDPYRLNEVFLVRKAHLAAEELAGPAPQPPAPPAPADAPSIQQRYAP